MADLVNITIDGQKIAVPKGALVIEAATQIGVDVPRFCYHPKLSAVGMCRMCLGEVGTPKMNPDRTPALNEDGTPQIAMMPKPQTLCTTQATEGMVVLSETPAVVKMREGVLEFFLANHPLDCPICDKGGECMLQDQSMAYAHGASRVKDMYHLRKDLAKNHHLSELITLDRERCIQCARCTRFQDEVAQDKVLELVARGSKTMIDTLSDPPFDSKYSGNTIDICPVGALTSRDFRFRARVWELQNVPTVSMTDGSGTNIFVSQRNETLVRIIPRDNEAINECWISDRDRFGLDYVDHSARLTGPLVRRNGQFEPVSWDDALQLVADKIKAAKESKGANAVAAIGSPKLTNEGALAMARLFRETIGTPSVDHVCAPTLASTGKAPASFYEELEAADVILVVDSNPNEELAMLDLRLKKAAFQRKAHLITCNPTQTPLDRLAREAFVVNEGSEVALLNGLCKLVHQSWTAEPEQTELLRNTIEGREGATAWVDSLGPYASTRVAELCGIDEAAVRAAATAIAGSERLFIIIGENASPATMAALQNLATLKGRNDYLLVAAPGANSVGVRRAGLVPGEGGKNGAEILEATSKGDIKVLYLAGINPLNSAADTEAASRALATAEFVVVQALFLGELTEHADVVLPAASFLEQSGSTTNFAGKVQTLKQALRPRERRDDAGNTLSACAPDWVIFAKLAQLLGGDLGYTSAADVTAQFKAIPAAPAPESKFTQIGYEASPAQLPAGSFRLLSGSAMYDGGESFQYCERLLKVVPLPYVQMNRGDARRLGFEKGDLVELKTGRGSARVRLEIGKKVKEGTLWIPRRQREVRAGALLQQDAPFTAATITRLKSAAELTAEPVLPSGELRGDVDPAATLASGMPSATT